MGNLAQGLTPGGGLLVTILKDFRHLDIQITCNYTSYK